MNGVTFGTKHSFNDFGMILSSKEIGIPDPKTKIIEVPGADGVIDLTEVLNKDVKYNNRLLSFTFTVIDPIASWSSVLSKVTNYIHGQKLQIILDWDKNYYYEGRCEVNKFQTNKRLGLIIIDADCGPYKINRHLNSEPWIWDTFNFETGVINTNTVTVEGTKTVTVVNERKIVSPTFTCSDSMSIIFNGVNYSLPKGKSTNLDIRLQEGENIIQFKGTGTVIIDYRGGSL